MANAKGGIDICKSPEVILIESVTGKLVMRFILLFCTFICLQDLIFCNEISLITLRFTSFNHEWWRNYRVYNPFHSYLKLHFMWFTFYVSLEWQLISTCSSRHIHSRSTKTSLVLKLTLVTGIKTCDVFHLYSMSNVGNYMNNDETWNSIH